MFVLVMGRNKSGKSRYAEKLCARMAEAEGTPLLYLATMIPFGEGEEGAGCVARHRRQREPYDFTTLERPFNIAQLPAEALPPAATVLLEDVSNLLANNIFSPREGIEVPVEGFPAVGGAVYEDVLAFAARCRNLAAVSIGGLVPSHLFDEGTNGYINTLNGINGRLFEAADVVVEMEDGKPHIRKGSLP